MNLEELTPATAAFIFLGAPIALIGLIWLSVLLSSRAARRRAAKNAPPIPLGTTPPAGIEPLAAHGDEPATPQRWTVRCTTCTQAYQRSGALAQFENPDAATRAALRHNWVLHPDGLRCPGCGRLGLTR